MRRIASLIGMAALLGMVALTPAWAAAPAKVVGGLNSDVRSFDPINTLDTTTDRVISNIYEYLFTRDRDMKVVPLLAESGRPIDDLTWEIKLRKNVKFSDGEPFNAGTVKANPTVVDEHTVRITTEKPFPTLLEGLTEIYMAPVKAIGDPKMLTEKPIGTGPYRLQGWKREQSIALVRTDGCWGPKPQIPAAEIRIIPAVAARIAALLAGEVHLIPDVPPQSIDQVKPSGTPRSTAKSMAGLYSLGRVVKLTRSLRLAGPRPADRAVHPVPGLPHGAGGGVLHRGLRVGDQPRRAPAVRAPEPQDPV
ncbi:MAG TPA: ABC transporter substrate-binding protein [Candidatus Sulfotelmatobacter sp.]|nr:ABC transporter substrate-binding protein [Candidatus Sulfotelmatobacter sp.]